MLRRRPDARGFTLLEVLIALLVLALALVALIRTASQSTLAFSELRERTVAGWVAANALSEARLETGLPALGVREGSMAMARRDWSYRITVSNTPAAGIRRLHVEVFDAAQDMDDDALVSLDGFAGSSLSQ